MTQQFTRTAKLLVRREEEIKEFENLRIEFDVLKGDDSDANTSKIAIYNLNESSRKFFESQKLTAQLTAGYKGIVDDPVEGIIFLGDVAETKTAKKGADILTILEVGDSEENIINSFLDKTYKAGTFYKNIISDLISNLGVIFNSKELEKLSNKKIFNSLTVSGQTKKNLDKILENENFFFTIQTGELKLIKKNVLDKNKAILLTPKTGLLNIPIVKNDGLEILALINSLVRPGTTIKVESENVNGFFLTESCEFKGDTRGKDWFMKIEAANGEDTNT